MKLISIISLAFIIPCLSLAIFILFQRKNKVHYVWAVLNVVLALWGVGFYLVGISPNSERALNAWRFAHVCIMFVPPVFYHMVHTFCGLTRRIFLKINYLQAFLFACLFIFTDFIINNTNFVFGSLYYYRATPGYFLTFFTWSIFSVVAFKELLNFIKKAGGSKRIQASYLFIGALFGFLGGTTTILPSFGFLLYPAGHSAIVVYLLITAYAILKYQFMDIGIAMTRLSIFVVVYILVLGIPFGLLVFGKSWLITILGEHWAWAPMLILVTLATAGPFIFLYFQRKAEEMLLQEEQRSQELLIQASYGMNTIHNLQKLLNLIIDVVVKTLRLSSAKIFLLNRKAEEYVSKTLGEENGIVFSHSNVLVEQLREKQDALIYDEIKMLSDMNGETELCEVETQMRNLSANVIVPIALNNSLLGFLTLGERRSKNMYTKGLLNALSVLGNNAAIAIDRCNYIAAETKRLEAEGLRERMVSLDHMASSMAHEIDNPMHIIRTSLSFVKSALLRDPRVSMPEEIKQDFDDSLARSLNASERVSSMIKAILDYSRMGTGKLESIRISDALEGFLQLIHPQIREERVQFTKEIENDLPPVLGDRVQMEEVFMNFVRNSLHAVRRNEEKKISLKIFRKNETIIRIECSDNGYGIPREIINDIFLSSMTTKGSTEGTGLGLFRVRKIVDIFRGKVWAESEGKGKGATFIVELPVYEGNKSNINGNEKS